MTGALVALAAEAGRRVAILGEMLELGEASAAAHRSLAAACADIDAVWCVGAGMRALYDALPPEKRLGYALSADDVDADALARLVATPATILVKGSNRVFWVKDFVPRLLSALAG
jgi:UDP-N-acetylmuramoyl-tripeptide--D-alanyl-D-alanine ligase